MAAEDNLRQGGGDMSNGGSSIRKRKQDGAARGRCRSPHHLTGPRTHAARTRHVEQTKRYPLGVRTMSGQRMLSIRAGSIEAPLLLPGEGATSTHLPCLLTSSPSISTPGPGRGQCGQSSFGFRRRDMETSPTLCLYVLSVRDVGRRGVQRETQRGALEMGINRTKTSSDSRVRTRSTWP